jgi:hypothetical protein
MMNLIWNKRRTLLLSVFAVIIGIRFINITMPILEGTAMRQVQTAMIARNFFKDGINIFYPRVDHFGNTAGYLVLELPLLNALAALGYMLLGGVHEWVGRLLSIFFFTGAAYFLYAITKKILDETHGFWAVLVFGLSPLSIIFSRAFMPDFEMLFFSLGALYFLVGFCDNKKSQFFWVSAVFMSIAMLVKPQSFYIFIPLIYLICRKEKWRFLLDYKNYIYLVIALLPAILWFLHAKSVHLTYTQNEAYNFQVSNWFDLSVLFSKDLYAGLIKICSGILLTPIGLTLLIFGLFIKTKDKENLIWPWLLGSLLYVLAFITHMWEPYYYLSLLPVASVFIARAIIQIKYIDWKKWHLNYKQIYVILIILFLPFFLRYSAYAYVVPKGYRYIPEAGRRIQAISKKGDLIIASAAGGPQALYFCDRKGWSFMLPQFMQEEKEAIDMLRNYIERGGKYFVAAKMDDFENSSNFREYILKNYKLIEYEKSKFIIFKLR